MKEIISINVGQPGVQLGNATWELFCIEHGVRADGTRNSQLDLDPIEENGNGVFFDVTKNSHFVPRVVTIDMEPTVIDEIRVGPYRRLFHPESLITGNEDCASNFARGSLSVGKEYLDTVLPIIRKQVESCNSLQGFCLLNSFDGGTSSGFTSILIDRLSLDYAKYSKIQLGIFPSSKYSSSTVYPYNGVLHTHSTTDSIDLSVLMDNEALFKICSNKLNIQKPSFSCINRIVSQLYSSLTVSLRYTNQVNCNLDQLSTNLVPFPRIHFPLSHMSPLLPFNCQLFDSSEVINITSDIFLRENQLVDVDTSNSAFMACILQYRGLLTPNEVNRAIGLIKSQCKIQFVDWCPTGYKIGISSKPSAITPCSPMTYTSRSLMMMSNSSAIVEVWESLQKKFHCLYQNRSFVHWFVGEGLEEGEFNEAINNIKTLQRDYRELSTDGTEIE